MTRRAQPRILQLVASEGAVSVSSTRTGETKGPRPDPFGACARPTRTAHCRASNPAPAATEQTMNQSTKADACHIEVALASGAALTCGSCALFVRGIGLHLDPGSYLLCKPCLSCVASRILATARYLLCLGNLLKPTSALRHWIAFHAAQSPTEPVLEASRPPAPRRVEKRSPKWQVTATFDCDNLAVNATLDSSLIASSTSTWSTDSVPTGSPQSAFDSCGESFSAMEVRA